MTDENSIEQLKNDILKQVQVCSRCRMCVNTCPTHEGWLTQSPMGRIWSINLHFKHGLGDEKELSALLYDCASCRRCRDKCRMLAFDVNPTDIILRARQMLVLVDQETENN